MRKLLSIILVVVMLLSLFSVNVYAENLYGCKDAFLDKYHITGNEEHLYLTYYELGEMDIDCDDVMDFVLIYATFGDFATALTSLDMENRFIALPHICNPFEFGYALFDLETKEFIPLSEQVLNDYPQIFYYLDLFDIGDQYGDADRDGVLSILDATFIQRALVNLEEFSYHEYLGEFGLKDKRRSDFDHDSQVTILDATAIQKSLVKE